jgi:hypothetical protein
MAQDSLARELSAVDAPPDDAIYEALVAALRSNARGRAFLDEYARRARAADTAAALAALARIEALLTREREREREREAVQPEALDGKPDVMPAPERPPHPSGADLLAQVMALSPEERIALFS